MKKPVIQVIREGFTDTSTYGKMYINGSFFCYTLEDIVRPFGVKVYGKTAIPKGLYNVNVTYSGHFRRHMPILYNMPNRYELRGGGIAFSGVRIHGGNTAKDTHGCILVAKKRIDEDTIQGTAEEAVTKKIYELLKEDENLQIEIVQNFDV